MATMPASADDATMDGILAWKRRLCIDKRYSCCCFDMLYLNLIFETFRSTCALLCVLLLLFRSTCALLVLYSVLVL